MQNVLYGGKIPPTRLPFLSRHKTTRPALLPVALTGRSGARTPVTWALRLPWRFSAQWPGLNGAQEGTEPPAVTAPNRLSPVPSIMEGGGGGSLSPCSRSIESQ